MFWPFISYLSLNKLILIIILSGFANSQSLVFPEHIHEKCISKSNANDVRLNCEPKRRIVIHEAFFTSSVKHRCLFNHSLSTITEAAELTSEDYENMNSYPRIPSPCTDDLRLSLNKRCSGVSNCTFNLMKDHIPGCVGEDGSVVMRYTCVAEDKFQPFCNLNLTQNYGYISTPGYPSYYPTYEKCVWDIEGANGQIIQIDILDASIREPQRKPSNNRRKESYTCSDKLVVVEDNTKVLTVCGESKTSLVQYRAKTNRLTVYFQSFDFSPTRGILFRFSIQNCPTIAAPKDGHLLRNGSYAYYSCCFDYVFEDTKEPERVLFCEFGNRWNSTVPKCIVRDTLISSSLTLDNNSDNRLKNAQIANSSSEGYISDILVPVLLMITLLLGNAVIVWVLFRLKRKQKHENKNTESNIPLNSGSTIQTNV